MASIPAGCFSMGDALGDGNSWELPVHNVCLSAFEMDVKEIVVETLAASQRPELARLETENWIDVQPPFEDAHFIKGSAIRTAISLEAGLVLRFRPASAVRRSRTCRCCRTMGRDRGSNGRGRSAIAGTDFSTKFQRNVVVAQTRGRPTVLCIRTISQRWIGDGVKVSLAIIAEWTCMPGLRRCQAWGSYREGIWPNEAFEDGHGINTLTGADQPAPCAGGAFHDNRVWLRPAR
jgi:hypothetical protein